MNLQLTNENFLLITKMLQSPYCAGLSDCKRKNCNESNTSENGSTEKAENERRICTDLKWFTLCRKFEIILRRLEKFFLDWKRIQYVNFKEEESLLKLVESEFNSEYRQLFKDFICAVVERLREFALVYVERKYYPINFEKVYWAISYTMRNKIKYNGQAIKSSGKPYPLPVKTIWSIILESFSLFFNHLSYKKDEEDEDE